MALREGRCKFTNEQCDVRAYHSARMVMWWWICEIRAVREERTPAEHLKEPSRLHLWRKDV